MKFDFKSLVIGFLFAACIFQYMDKNNPGRYQAVNFTSGADRLIVAIIDTHTGEVVKHITAGDVEGWQVVE